MIHECLNSVHSFLSRSANDICAMRAAIFSCEGAALEVLMSVCPSVDKLKFKCV